jgi:hypothetical protein
MAVGLAAALLFVVVAVLVAWPWVGPLVRDGGDRHQPDALRPRRVDEAGGRLGAEGATAHLDEVAARVSRGDRDGEATGPVDAGSGVSGGDLDGEARGPVDAGSGVSEGDLDGEARGPVDGGSGVVGGVADDGAVGDVEALIAARRARMTGRVCPACEQPRSPSDVVCSRCGAPLPRLEEVAR